MEYLDPTQDSASMDEVQCSIEKLNNNLTQMADDYLDAAVGYFDLGFAEIETPNEDDVLSKIENLTETFDEVLSVAFGYTDGRNNDILVQIRDMILLALSLYEPVFFDLSEHGRDKYTDKESWQFTDHFIARVRGDKEHWYKFWTFWTN